MRRALDRSAPAARSRADQEVVSRPPEPDDAVDPASQHVRAIFEERTRSGRGAPAASFAGRRVLTLESRRSPELALLIMNYGGRPFVAPSVREVPLESNDQVVAFARDVIDRRFDLIVLLTGVGVRMMLKVIDAAIGCDDFIKALGRTRIVARGPKPVAALREIGLSPWATAPSPNTWRELLTTLDGRAGEASIDGATVAVQEYGSENPQLVEGLTSRGANVLTVPIYRWAMPDDIRPLRRAVWAIIRHEIDIVVLTASVQLVHLLRMAREMGLEAALRQGLERTVIASIGPMSSDELRRNDLSIDFEPSHPKMGFLVKEAAEECDALLRAKHAQNQ